MRKDPETTTLPILPAICRSGHTMRTPSLIASAFAELGVATTHEAQGRSGLLHQRLQPRQADVAIAGTAVTCEVPPGDNWMIHVALEQA